MLISSKELCRRTSASYRQVDYWSRIGIFGPVGPYSPGSGHTREWDEIIVDKVRLLAKLSRFFGGRTGVSTNTLIMIYENYEKGSVNLEEGITLSWNVKEDREQVSNIEPFCIKCRKVMLETDARWKCCPTHTPEPGPRVVCDTCIDILHPHGR